MKAGAVLFALLLIGPLAFLAYPSPAHAIPVEVTSDTSITNIKTSLETTISAVKNAASYVLDVSNTAANVAKQIKSYVLDPIAFIVSGNLLKSITSGILSFVGGNNGTGKPLFVQNLTGYLQNVGDVQAYSFLNQFSSSSNSPFANAITSSLRTNYLQQTSLAGFFGANKNTLSSYSPNINQFLAGDWSQGGAAAWFGLTTQDQNNPYTLYYRSQDQLVRTVNNTASAKLSQLNWGQGFMSWCGSTGNTSATAISTSPVGGGDTGTGGGGTGDFGGGVDCPAGAVPAGSGGCQYINPEDGSGQFTLPVGYSCPGGGAFDGSSGGCTNTDGTFAYALNAQGQSSASTNLASNDTGGATGSTGNLTDSSASGNAGQILTDKINSLKGADAGNFADHLTWDGSPANGGQCWSFVRNAECSAGYNTCTANGQASVGILNGAGFTTIASNANAATLNSTVQNGDVIGINCSGGSCSHVEMNVNGTYVSDTIQKGSNPYHWASPNGVTYTIFRPPAKTSLQNTGNTNALAAVAEAPAAKKSGTIVGNILAFLWDFLPFTGANNQPALAAAVANAKGTVYLDKGNTDLISLQQQTNALQQKFPGQQIVDSNCGAVPAGSTVVSYSAGGSCLKTQMNNCSNCDFILIDANNNNGALGAVVDYNTAHPGNVQLLCTSGYDSDICNSSALSKSTCTGGHLDALSSCDFATSNTSGGGTGTDTSTVDNGSGGSTDTGSDPSLALAAVDGASGGSAGGGPTTGASTGGESTGGANVNGNYGGGGIPQPGDSCTKPDGTQGQIQTPGSVIKDFLSKALGSSIDKLVGVGDISASISGILSNIGTVMQTVNLATSLFGGTNGLLGGVAGNGSYTSPFAQYLNSPDYLGVTVQDVGTNTNIGGVSDFASRTSQYQSAWNSIGPTITNAATNLNSIIASCPTRAGEARTELTNVVNPALARYAVATSTIANANAEIAQVQNEASMGDANYATDLATLVTQPPSATDVAQAQQDAQDFGDATASPDGSLNASASTLYAQMNRISGNARAYLNNPDICPPPPPPASNTDTTPVQTVPADSGGGG